MTREVHPARLITLSYFVIIVTGGILLALPIASRGVPVLDAFFAATSATCVTGLVVHDTALSYTLFGKIVLAFLIQLGGLGYMTISTAFLFILGRRTSVQDRLLMKESINYLSYRNLRRFAFAILAVTGAIEGAGALVMFIYFLGQHFPAPAALFHALFHAVSAFCNAGFSTFSDNLAGYGRTYLVPGVVAGLLIAGGVGFVVISDLYRRFVVREVRHLSTHSKLALAVTAGLIVGGTALFAALEWNRALAPYPWPNRLMLAFFQAVTPRTAGFNTVDLSILAQPAALLLIVLMFIGASPGGTGGGIKTTTFAIVWLRVRSLLAGREPEAFRHRIDHEGVTKSFVIIFASLALVLTVSFAILLWERDVSFLKVLFEVTSAFGTVGLSLGSRVNPNLSLAHDFSAPSKLALMLTMLIGRIGTLTAISILVRPRAPRIQRPRGEVIVG